MKKGWERKTIGEVCDVVNGGTPRTVVATKPMSTNQGCKGLEELDQDKLSPLLRLKYHDSLADAVAELGPAQHIGELFSGFQKYLYLQDAAGGYS